MLVVPEAEAAVLGVEPQFDLALFENGAVLVAQHGQQHAAFQVRPRGVPIDVEIAGIG